MIEIVKDLTQLEKEAEVFNLIKEDKSLNKEASDEIIKSITDVLMNTDDLLALSAPQIGIPKRIFCVKFNDTIKTFINPIITAKKGLRYSIETLPNKSDTEYFIGRPQEITAVYYNSDFKYEENKFLEEAAALFDQQCQLLDGFLPNLTGMEFPVENGLSLLNAPQEVIEMIAEKYNIFISNQLEQVNKDIADKPELQSAYRQLKFTEDVINGRSRIVTKDPKQSVTTTKAKQQEQKALSKANLNKFLKKRGK